MMLIIVALIAVVSGEIGVSILFESVSCNTSARWSLSWAGASNCSGVRCGYWYDVSFRNSVYNLVLRKDLLERAQPKVFAFDIECTHAPLRFPDSAVDQITMISYMLDQQGYLIVNRALVSEDISDFEYTPKPEFKGNFIVFNELTEDAALRRFFHEIRTERPHVFVSFNGDGFDWPFIEARAKFHSMSMKTEIGVSVVGYDGDVYSCHYASHLDCYRWVVRDSYLPVGSQGLKAVTKAKLGYDPLELDPEDMVKFASERPQELAAYSVSDAVATYFLYKNYVHPFIFSLATLIPMNPDDVLRKGSGTLCEILLMVQAQEANVIFPNKQKSGGKRFHNQHLIEKETYIGGHVESLRSGVYRSDIPIKFDLDPMAFEELAESLDATLRFAIEVEANQKVEACTNLTEVKQDIVSLLKELQENPAREEKPMIYHLDVGAMYPNIILTNRLQPSAVVDTTMCAACDFNKPENQCQKKLGWTWRGELFPCNRSEFELVKSQLESERFPSPANKERKVSFFELPHEQRNAKLTKRLKDYCQRVYRKNHITVEEQREDTVCMRENSFYVDTVRLFRDRRYEYKAALRTWKGKLKAAEATGNRSAIREAEEMVIVYDSLQVAHKCILNSFYGYVMRRGARWYSMEMAGMVTYTGAEIIKNTRLLVERIGTALELDTDGIWCCLPETLPETYIFKFSDGKSFKFDYSCIVLNYMVSRDFTNHTYQEKVGDKEYTIRKENSIFFEVDGPYRAMFLPSAIEEGKTLKKRYAVFRMDGSLAELKGFELKRRGELKLIKTFQSQVFKTFLLGDTLEGVYGEVAKVADRWLDVLYNKGANLEDDELLELLSSSSNMSKPLHEYGSGKSNAITTARRLAEFLGPQVVAKKGLACRFVITKEPAGSASSDRALPVIIFNADPNTKNHFIRKWIKDTAHVYDDYGIRDILDWDYYIKRFETTLQKIVTVPAAMQGIANPMPRVEDPDWLKARRREEADPHKQVKINSFFSAVAPPNPVPDIEALALQVWKTPVKQRRTPRKRRESSEEDEEGNDVPPTMMDLEGGVMQEDADESEEPDRGSDYTAWLRWQKARWKLNREERLGRQGKRGKVTSTKEKGAGDFVVRSYADKERFRFAKEPWRVIQVLPVVGAPGEFTVWALLGDKMSKIRVLHDRILHVNSTSENVAASPKWPTTKVELALPRSKPSLNLHEIRIPERTFRRNFKELTEAFTAADVAGVYGTKTTLLYQVLVQMGSVCSVRLGTLSDNNDLPSDTFNLSMLDRRSTKEVNYLQPDEVQRVYLYHSYNSDRSKAVYAVGFPGSDSVHVNFCSSSRIKVDALRDVVAKTHPESHLELHTRMRMDLVARDTNRLLHQYRLDTLGAPAMIILQTTLDEETVREDLPELNEFPVVRVSANKQDNTLDLRGDWPLFACKCLLQRRAHIEDWTSKQLQFSTYAQMPIGNFSLEMPSMVSDVFFSRLLHDHRFVAWSSDSMRPDLGGSEVDNNVLVQLENICIERPGCYDTVCIELSIQHLAINSVLQSHLVHSAEGVASAAATNVGPGERDIFFETFDDTSDCIPAFQALRSLVVQWTADIGASAEEYNEWAELLLNNMYHWISSPTSKLYDPALHKFVHLLMRKVFLQFLQSLKQLGSNVVYADFNKIIVVTNKHTIEDAKAYWAFIETALSKQDLFSWMTIEPEVYWQTLLYLGPTDFGGIQDDGVPVSSWNLAEYLPPTAHDHFLVTVTEFAINLTQLMAKERGSELKRLKSSNSELFETRADLVGSNLSQKLFSIVHEIHNSPAIQQQHTQVRAVMPGARNTHESPAVQFIVSLCHVLALDKLIQPEVATLRKNLLRLVNLDDFSAEATFVHPCSTYVVNDVICDFCAAPRSLDLLRDPLLLAHDWACPHCKHHVDKHHVEALLVDTIYTKSYQFQSQDLVCSKCTLLKESNMTQMCADCSGVFNCKISQEEMKAFFATFHDIAKYHNMIWLLQIVENFQLYQ